MTGELDCFGVIEIAQAIAQRRVSAREVVQHSLASARRWQPAINAFTALHEEPALQAAGRADALVARGERIGPLHGVPLAHKDMYFRMGRASGCGARRPVHGTSTSTLLARLDAAGAIELGALHMCEYALGPTGHNAHLGDCRNPWNSSYVSGGSSSGSGAAVAARIVPAALGSDTGGSIRLPASLCGVLGLKPTFGVLSRHGSLALSPSVDTPGICARSTRDLALLLDILAGYDPADPHSTAREHVPALPTLDAAPSGTSRPLAGLRVGRPRRYFLEQVDADVAAALDRSCRELESLGAVVVDVATPDPATFSELSRALVYAEATALHAKRLAEAAGDYSPQVRIRAATGLGIPAPVYTQALALRPRIVREFVSQAFADCDVLHLPTLAIAAPTLAETDLGGSALVWPKIAAMVRCTAPFNYLGLPALSVPCGRTANGLPTSFQLVGRPFDEVTLLRASAAYEPCSEPLRTMPEQARARTGSC
jgi:aspartyl-tRNA(Asn)/glutamyl-tRNA(Gln) amidotransferase subunit A